MDDKLSYKEARGIRKNSLSSLLADQMIQGEGVFSGLKKAISLKTRAKITGIKEKFDPLNIAKMLTGGSRLGPALLGKMTGRSREDIENFAGRVKYVNPKNRKISALPPGEQDSSGMKSVLVSIVGLLQKSFENDKKRREKENNFAEERKLEDEKRHKELLKALSMIGVGGGTATLIQKDPESKGFFESIFDSISDLMSMKNILKPILSLLTTAGSWLLGLIFSPAGAVLAGLIASGALAFYLAKWMGNYENDKLKDLGGEKAAEANRKMNAAPSKQVQGGTFESTVFEQSTEYETASKEKDAAIKEKQDIVAQIMKKKGYKRFYKTGLFGDRLKGQYTFEDPTGLEPPDFLLKDASKEADEIIKKRDAAKSQSAVPVPTPVPEQNSSAVPVKSDTAAPMGSSTGSIPDDPIMGSSTGSIPDATPTVPTPPVTPTPPVSQKLNNIIGENLSLNLGSTFTPDVASDSVKNVVVKNQNTSSGRSSIPSVRNHEDTFERMIMNSIRVV